MRRRHAHVVQPIRRRFGRFVVYGEGNLISSQTSACCPAESQDGLIAILRVRVASGQASVRRVDYVPIRVRYPDFRVIKLAAALRHAIANRRGDTAEAHALRRSYRGTVSWAGRSSYVAPCPRALPRG